VFVRLFTRHPGRRVMAERIAGLDPVADAATVYRLTAFFELPFEMRYGFNLALYRTFAIPGIAAVLARSGQITGAPAKRLADTGLFTYELIEAGGFDTPTAREIVRGLNRVHRGWGISNDQFLYVLATFVVVPARWVDRFGWRRLTEAERTAMAAFYRELGRRMGITDLPDSYPAFERLLDEYEAEHLAPSPAGSELMRATAAFVNDRLPQPVKRLGPVLTRAVLDDELARGLGLRPAPAAARIAVHRLMWLRGFVVRRMAPRSSSWFVPGTRARSVYPNGYTVADLGPEPP